MSDNPESRSISFPGDDAPPPEELAGTPNYRLVAVRLQSGM